MTLTTSTVEQTDAAQRHLAGQVLGQWRDEIDVRRLDDPGPLAVTWRFTELDVADHVEHVVREGRLRVLLGRGRHRFTGRTDRIGDIAARFRGLERRRLVILGEPGTGKTTLALLPLRELLDHAEPGEPVPVLVSPSDWDPGAETLHEWLTRRPAEDYPALRATAFGPDAARSLVTGRRVLPVLDGLDELPEGVRAAVLLRLNEVAADPLVLTCRTAEYQAAVTAPGGDVLTGGAVIEPDPLTPADAADYLAGCLPPGAAGDWRGLLATLTGDRRGPVTEALSTPLALWLLRKVYVDTGTHPAELCDRSRFPGADAVVEHLLDHLVAALITASPPRDGEHPLRPRRAWEPADATRWLTFLAHHLTTIGSRDFAWWRLHRTARRRVAVTSGLIAGLVLGVAVAVGEGLLVGPVNGALLGPLVGLVFGLVVGFARGLTIGHVAGLVFGSSLLGAGVGAGLVGGEPVVGLVFLVAGGIPVVIVGVLAARAVGFTPPETPAYADLRLRGRTRSFVRELTRWAGGDLVLRFVPGFSAGLVFGGVLGAAGETSDGLRSALVFALVFGGATGLAVGLVDWAETPQADDRPRTPVTAFRRDLRLVCLKSVVGGVVIGLAFWLQDVLSGTGGDRRPGSWSGSSSPLRSRSGSGLTSPAGATWWRCSHCAPGGKSRGGSWVSWTTRTGWASSAGPVRCTSSGTHGCRTTSPGGPCDDRAVTGTKAVGLHGAGLWAHDASLSLVLAETVRLVEESSPDRRPAWWPGVVRELRVHAVITEFHLDLDLGLSAGQRGELAQLFDEAAGLVRERGVFTADEAAAWLILDDAPVAFRGREPEPTGPAAESGHAVAQLIRGTLPPPPAGTWWFYGAPGGRRTIAMGDNRESR